MRSEGRSIAEIRAFCSDQFSNNTNDEILILKDDRAQQQAEASEKVKMPATGHYLDKHTRSVRRCRLEKYKEAAVESAWPRREQTLFSDKWRKAEKLQGVQVQPNKTKGKIVLRWQHQGNDLVSLRLAVPMEAVPTKEVNSALFFLLLMVSTFLMRATSHIVRTMERSKVLHIFRKNNF